MIQMILVSALLALLFLPLQISWWKMDYFRKWIPVRYLLGLVYGILLFYIGLLDQSITAFISAYLPIIGVNP